MLGITILAGKCRHTTVIVISNPLVSFSEIALVGLVVSKGIRLRKLTCRLTTRGKYIDATKSVRSQVTIVKTNASVESHCPEFFRKGIKRVHGVD